MNTKTAMIDWRSKFMSIADFDRYAESDNFMKARTTMVHDNSKWTLAAYVATRRELDEVSDMRVHSTLLRRAKITPGTPLADIPALRKEAVFLRELYLD